jgi:hypothetical protein
MKPITRLIFQNRQTAAFSRRALIEAVHPSPYKLRRVALLRRPAMSRPGSVQTGSYGGHTGSYGGAGGTWNWPQAIGYEVQMLTALLQIPSTHSVRSEWALKNSITEAIVLHTRNLCDFCTSTKPNDIKPCDLFDDYDTDPKYETLRGLMKRLDQKYGKNVSGDARWAFNKMLAHLSKDRGESFNYDPYLNRVVPVIEEIVSEMVALGLPRSIFEPPLTSTS